MIDVLRYDGVLQLAINNPSVNALGADVRAGIARGLTIAEEDEAISVVIISGNGTVFSGGADIAEFDAEPQEPWLPDLLDRVENFTKPVIAAIGGTALGGGLELALACHYRLAASGAKLGLPEIKLGLLPGAGGTQRLPRLIGLAPALDMILSGDPIAVEQAETLGLVDRIVGSEVLLEAAIAFASASPPIRPTGARNIAPDPELFSQVAQLNERKFAGRAAPAACIQAVKAASELPLGEGLAFERELFGHLLAGEESQALRHLFFAERRARKIEGLVEGTRPRSIRHVGVIGAGTMGGGIAMCFLNAGIAVTIVDTTQEALDRGIQIIRKNYDASAAKGRFSVEAVEQAMRLLTPTLEFDQLANCDLAIEAVYENMEVKKDIFRRLDRVARPDAILASNTSFLDIDEIAGATTRSSAVLGLHFFSPANVMKLVEVVRGRETAPDVLVTGMDIARRIGKVPVVAGVCYGFIGNRMLLPRQEQSIRLLVDGASVAQIDGVHTRFGMPMGPFQMADLAGVDIGWHRDPERIESIPDALCVAGRWGQKTKGGYYDYDDKRQPSPSATTTGIIERFRQDHGGLPRAIADEEIIARTLYTMVNEGLKILEEGIAQRSSDIDVVWALGYGWPSMSGGPMYWADQIGYKMIAEAIAEYIPVLGDGFQLSETLRSFLK